MPWRLAAFRFQTNRGARMQINWKKFILSEDLAHTFECFSAMTLIAAATAFLTLMKHEIEHRLVGCLPGLDFGSISVTNSREQRQSAF